ncbi:demethoxyubiquinone hydroxylase family protein, partial [Lysobacter sp.]|uniref:demethoxyubiquinone hydroxylase family protein n=1 Tax=Lysobacter sp. TaxID=72226 RepID=UPI002D7A26B2
MSSSIRAWLARGICGRARHDGANVRFRPIADIRLRRHMDLGSRILKVNHAGEFGAISIYTGQIVVA